MTTTLQKILYVEDDDLIAEIVVMTLEDLGGFEVVHASSGKEALSIFPVFQPQLILLDVMMPGMDGVETLKNIRELESDTHVPAVFVTAKAQAHEQDLYTSFGAVGVIVKPFDPETLCAKIDAFYQASL